MSFYSNIYSLLVFFPVYVLNVRQKRTSNSRFCNNHKNNICQRDARQNNNLIMSSSIQSNESVAHSDGCSDDMLSSYKQLLQLSFLLLSLSLCQLKIVVVIIKVATPTHHQLLHQHPTHSHTEYIINYNPLLCTYDKDTWTYKRS